MCTLFTTKAQEYSPSASNLKQRAWFEDARFGLFIHWGPLVFRGVKSGTANIATGFANNEVDNVIVLEVAD